MNKVTASEDSQWKEGETYEYVHPMSRNRPFVTLPDWARPLPDVQPPIMPLRITTGEPNRWTIDGEEDHFDSPAATQRHDIAFWVAFALVMISAGIWWVGFYTVVRWFWHAL